MKMKSCLMKTVFSLLCVSFCFPSIAAEQKTKTDFEAKKKEFVPELLIDARKGDIDDNYALYNPSAVTTDSKGNIYILDAGNNRMMKYDKTGRFLKKWGKKGLGPGEFNVTNIHSIAAFLATDNEDNIYVLERDRSIVQVFDSAGNYQKGLSLEWGRGFESIAVNSRGDIYVAAPSQAMLPEEYNPEMTIFKYKRRGETYKLTKKFSPAPLQIRTKRIDFGIIGLALNYSESQIAVNEKDEIFQLFFSIPIIRKFSPSDELLWEKLDFDLWKEFGADDEWWWRERFTSSKKMSPQEIQNLLQENQTRYFDQISIDNKNRRLLIRLIGNRMITLDYNGAFLDYYLPDKEFVVLNRNPEKGKENRGNFKKGYCWVFTYSNAMSEGLFLSSMAAELWITAF